jgi:hypothetical protein
MNKTDYDPYLNTAILEVVDNQLRDNDPPAVRATLERLKKEGHSEREAKRLIGAALAAEIYDILKTQSSFNLDQYVGNLNRLPEMPWERWGDRSHSRPRLRSPDFRPQAADRLSGSPCLGCLPRYEPTEAKEIES